MKESDAHRLEASDLVSVVVATHNRGHLVHRLVSTLEHQREVGEWELVVVNDGSTDETAAELERLAEAHRRLRVIHLGENRGPATARNVGWRVARGSVIAFTDDDCVTDPNWLSSLVRRIESGADVVQGQILPDPDGLPGIGAFGRTIEPVTELNPFFATCNVAYRRQWLERLDGFDERFPYPWCEDVDLGQRAVAAGARVAFEPDALVVHDVFPQTWWQHVHGRRRRVSDVMLLDKHPHMRGFLGGVNAHTPALVALAALLVLGLTRAPVLRAVAGSALVLPYLRHRSRVEPPHVPPHRWPVAVAGLWVADVYEALRFIAARMRSARATSRARTRE